MAVSNRNAAINIINGKIGAPIHITTAAKEYASNGGELRALGELSGAMHDLASLAGVAGNKLGPFQGNH